MVYFHTAASSASHHTVQGWETTSFNGNELAVQSLLEQEASKEQLTQPCYGAAKGKGCRQGRGKGEGRTSLQSKGIKLLA